MKIGAWDTMLKRKATIWIAILLLFLLASLFISKKISTVVEEKLNTYLYQQNTLPYHISFKTLKVNLLSGSVRVDSVRISPKKAELSDSVKGMFNGFVESIHIQNVGYFDYWFKHKISIGNLSIEGSELSYIPNSKYVKKAKRGIREHKIVIDEKIKSIEVGVVDFVHTQLSMYKSNAQNELVWNVDDVSLSMKRLMMDSSTVHNEPPFSFADIKLDAENSHFGVSDFYNIGANSLSYNSTKQKFIVEGFKLKPKYSRKQFSNRLAYENDMFDVYLKSLELSGLDIKELLHSKHLQLSAIRVDSPLVSIYRDKRVSDGPYKHKALITTAIKRIPISTQISKVHLFGGKLTYEEQQSNGNAAGLIYFDLDKIQIANVCNITAEIHDNPVMEVDIRSKIMGAGELNAHFDFFLSCVSDSFFVKGILKKTEASVFNPMTKNLLHVNIESGTVNEVNFAFHGTDDASSGVLELDYSNLKVDVLKSGTKKNKFISFVANEVVYNRNVKGSKKYRKGYVYFVRDKNKGFPNYLWKSLSSAIAPVVAPLSESKKHKLFRANSEEIE